MHFNQRIQKRISTGLMILFLSLALIPFHLVMNFLVSGGHFVQLCTGTGMQTVWVADDASTDKGISVIAARSDVSQSESTSDISTPFGSCAFCWVSVLATILPLILVVFTGATRAKFSLPIARSHSYLSFLRYWHVSPRAPPFSLAL